MICKHASIMVDILDQDVKDGVFRKIFLGAFSHMALRWMIVKDEKKRTK